MAMIGCIMAVQVRGEREDWFVFRNKKMDYFYMYNQHENKLSWPYTTCTLIPMQELWGEEGGGLRYMVGI